MDVEGFGHRAQRCHVGLGSLSGSPALPHAPGRAPLPRLCCQPSRRHSSKSQMGRPGCAPAKDRELVLLRQRQQIQQTRRITYCLFLMMNRVASRQRTSLPIIQKRARYQARLNIALPFPFDLVCLQIDAVSVPSLQMLHNFKSRSRIKGQRLMVND